MWRQLAAVGLMVCLNFRDEIYIMYVDLHHVYGINWKLHNRDMSTTSYLLIGFVKIRK